jgi:hypothetical protein
MCKSLDYNYMAAILLLLSPLFVSGVLGQTTVGVVRGTVHDQAGAVVPNAAVTLQNLETNSSRRTNSDESGLYDFPNVPPGKYQLTVEQAGFKKWSGNLELQVQQTAVVDPALEVGDVASRVEVTGVTPVISPESSSIANVTEAQRIRELPLNGLDITNLFQLTPGVEGSGSPRVNGLKAGGAEILQDGGSIVDRMSGGLPRIQPGLDTIQEFNVDMNSTAQFSRPATITIVTKSGTNQLHGSLFEKFRNNADGLRARSRSDGNVQARYNRNEFGASAGGPLLFPKLYHGKDKTFWFFSYQGQRLRQYTYAADDVPTQAMWNGDFSGLRDAQGNQYTIYDPYSTTANGTRTPFAGNQIPSSVASNSLFDYLAKHTPLPTTSTNPLAGNNYFATAAQPYDINQYTGKLDHRLTDKDYLSFRFSVANSDQYGYLGYGAPASDLAYNYYRELVNLYSGTLSYTHTFSPTIINEFLIAGQRSVGNRGGGQDATYWDKLLGLSNPLNESGWPTITGGFAGGNYGGFIWDSENKSPEHLNKLVPEDNLTLVRGKHEFKVGFRLSNERNNTRGAQQGQGRYKFNGELTALWDSVNQTPTPFTGVGMADMRLGYGSYYRINYNRPYFYIRQSEMGSYALDSWKVSPRLTLNYGLRWDYWTPYFESSNRMFAMDVSQYQTTQQLITPAGHSAETLGLPPSLLQSYADAGLNWTTADKAGFPSKLTNGDKRDFAPRFGAAYKLNNKTVLRGGYGMYYWTVPMSQMLLSQLYSVPLTLEYTTETDYWNQINYYDVFHPPVPGEKVGDPAMVKVNSVQGLQTPFGFTPIAKNWKNARAQEWNFTIERELSPLTSLRISYVGNHGSNLEDTVQLNAQQSLYLYASKTGQGPPANFALLRANPFWQDLFYRDPIGYSNSNSIQVNVQRRTYKGLQFQWYYVFTRALSTTDSNGYASNPGDLVPDAVTLPNGGSLSQRLKLDYYNVGAVPKHQVNWNLIYDLPFGRGKAFGKTASGVWNQIIGNWQIASIGGMHSGQWLTPQNAQQNPYGPNFIMISDPRLSADQRKVINFNGTPQLLYFRGNFDPTGTGLTNYQPALIQAGPNQDGLVPVKLKDGSTQMIPYDVYNSMPKNFIEGPKQWYTDFSVFKNFQVAERWKVRFTADAFNVFNHPNDINPNTSTGLIDLSQQSNEPRIIQFSLRLDF